MSKASSKITEKRVWPGEYQVFKGTVLIGYMIGSMANYTCLDANKKFLMKTRGGLQGAREYWKGEARLEQLDE